MPRHPQPALSLTALGKRYGCAGFLLLILATAVMGEEPAESTNPLPSLEEKTDGLTGKEGFFTFFPDDEAGTVWLQIDRWEEDFLYASGLSTGLGSNPVGLDRGQWGKTRLVRFQRVGRRVYLIEQNTRYRALTSNPAEQQAVKDSFAGSVIWSAGIAARSGDRCLVDAATLLIRDAHQVINTLKDSGQGDYQLNKDLSFAVLDRCLAFPENTELEATLTFSSKQAGSLVEQTAADGGDFSLRLHHSLVKLPGPGYVPRRAHPRVGSFDVTFANYAAALDEPLTQRWITRHRLHKADPTKEQSPPVEPIVYYLDSGTPQPVQDALLQGARWWAAAFEEAGFLDAFEVRLLPADADPMDVRYNVIQWVHRSTRGWSYGQSIVDPRTGEIIKGHVLLGSLRVRQDRLIIDGLTSSHSPNGTALCHCCGVAGGGGDEAMAQLDPEINPIEVSLSRLRQLSAHEVGHTLGFSHNFAASTYGDRASVMDYPAPRVRITEDQELDLSDAYGVGVGAWDRFMVRYAYSTFADEESEAQGLANVVDEARENGFLFLSDADARPAGAAHPQANLWDNGSDSIAELTHIMRVRRLALEKLEARDLLPGQPLADLEMVLAPVYLYHRYQVAATAKLIGGFDYHYASGDEEQSSAVTAIPADRQKQALAELLKTLEAEALVIPERLLGLLPPKRYSGPEDRERFSRQTAVIFDPSAAAQSAADLTLSHMLQPERLARLAAYPQPTWGLRTVLTQVVSALWDAPTEENERRREIQRLVQHRLVDHLITLAEDQSTSDSVRTATTASLREINTRSEHQLQTDAAPLGEDHVRAILDTINRFLNRPHTPSKPPKAVPVPPGSPIGF